MSLRELVLVFGDNGQYSRSIALEIVKRFPPRFCKKAPSNTPIGSRGSGREVNCIQRTDK